MFIAGLVFCKNHTNFLMKSLADSKNSRTFAEIYRDRFQKQCPFCLILRNLKLSNSLAIMWLSLCASRVVLF